MKNYIFKSIHQNNRGLKRLLSWLDIAYTVLNIFMMGYCYRNYLSSRKKAFQLFAFGFVCLAVSDFLWMFALVSVLDILVILLSYLRLGLYAIFILFVLRALQTS